MSPIDAKFQVPGVLVTFRGSDGYTISEVTPEGGIVISRYGETLTLLPDDPRLELKQGINWDRWLETWSEGQPPRSGEKL